LGARALNVPYIAFCDDDAWWEPGSLSRAADLLDLHPRVGLLNARVLVGLEGSLDPTCMAMAASPLAAEEGLPGPSLLGFLASAAVVRRSAFFECGGFDARLFLGGEEQLLAVDLATRGWRLCYVPQLLVRHYPSPHRDARDRRRLELRNALWFAWLRRPWKSVLRRSVQLIGAAPPSAAVKGALQALAGLPWIWRRRRVVSAEVERGLSRLDAWNARRGGEEQNTSLRLSADILQPHLGRQFLATAGSGDPAAEARE
jgi:GT2 family glycosyltransferase